MNQRKVRPASTDFTRLLAMQLQPCIFGSQMKPFFPFRYSMFPVRLSAPRREHAFAPFLRLFHWGPLLP